MSRVVGLIGGMSWQTTMLYYKSINQHVNSRLGGLHSANLLLRSIDYANIARMVTARDSEGMTRLLCDRGQELKRAGAESLALCANVAHKAADTLEKQTALPVLHVADFAAREVARSGLRKVGLLATQAVMEEDFYKARMRDRFGLDIIVPGVDFRAKADELIFRELSKDPIPFEAKKAFHTVYMNLLRDHGIDCVVLACTELRLVFDASEMDVPVFETTSLHAKGIAEWALDLEDRK